MIDRIIYWLTKLSMWAFLSLCSIYIGISIAPSRWFGYEPGQVHFADAPSGGVPAFHFSRTIRWDMWQQYRVIVRELDTLLTACEGDSLPFEYTANDGPILGKDLAWWVPGDFRCQILPDGPYVVYTTWFNIDPIGNIMRGVLGWDVPVRVLGPLTPTKIVTRRSNVFWVGPRPNDDITETP